MDPLSMATDDTRADNPQERVAVLVAESSDYGPDKAVSELERVAREWAEADGLTDLRVTGVRLSYARSEWIAYGTAYGKVSRVPS